MITGQIKRGGSLTVSVKQSGSLAPEIFWVTYGTTTAEEINQAITEQKVCVMSRDNSFYYLIRYTATEYFFASFDTTGEKIKYYRFYNNSWYYNTVTYQEALTFDTTPKQYSNNPVRSYGIWNAIKAVSDTVHSLPAGGTQGQVLKKSSDTDYEAEWADGSGSGSSDYTELSNKPSINGVTLYGNKTSTNLGLASASDVAGKLDNPSGGTVGQVLKKTASGAEWADESGGGGGDITVDDALSTTSENPVQNRVVTTAIDAKYAKPAYGIPSTDMTSAVQASLAKADTALQTAPVTSVNGQTGDVTVPAATDAQVTTAVNTWLGNNIAQETGYALDASLTMSNAAAPADKVGDLKSALDQAIEDFAIPTQEAVDNWLTAHPEATTTVQDGSLTEQKFSESLKGKTINALRLNSFSELYSNEFAKSCFLSGNNISAKEKISGIHDAYFRFDPARPFVWENKDSWETGYYNNGWIYENDDAVVFDGFKNVVFDGLSFIADIDDPDILTWTGIRLENCENVTFTNCHIEGFKWCGIDVSSVSNKDIRIENCFLRRCRFEIFDAGENTSIVNNTITDDYTSTQEYEDNGGAWKSDSSKDSLFYDGIIESGAGCLIANNTIYECGQSGIYSSSCSFLSVVGNEVHKNFNGGIDLGSVATDYRLHDISICGNTIYENHSMGINLTNLKNAHVIGNRSQNNGAACIVLEGNTKDSYIVGNYCYSADQRGVSVGLAVTDCSIVDTVGYSGVALVLIPAVAKSNGVKVFSYNVADYPFLTISVPNSSNVLDARNVMELSVDDSQAAQYWIANKPIVVVTDKSGASKQNINCGAINTTSIISPSIWLTSFIRLPQAGYTVAGAIWFDPSDKKLKYYDGTDTHVVANES